MPILFWILVTHTIIWAIGSLMANVFSPNLWSETTLEDKFIAYLSAEAQLLRAIVTIVKHRKRFYKIWSEKRNARKQTGE